ncbi:peptide monooxygenase [Patulibacter medicamentivorans]|uniref:L-lysine N6-monooxygenase MbtG n=1 Tax=Patulibacter medicamentivorans TaxID=1097667 RepID=H0E2J5_9ACTN|nr:SidA/IucD/PvdA family monooxygenase [Patulibacter medicamentivorans]EHN12105.1 peptide monooxygenase [Patulibacter medicamentivorans]
MSHDSALPVHDIVGIGFGPSNLALGIAIEERNRSAAPGDELDAVFLERQPRFGWHRGMLIDDATMQVSFLKDLVTMRQPASDFSFLAHLQAAGRLVDFINHKTIFPTRIEFHGYLEWVAGRLDHLAVYDARVEEVRPVLDGDGRIAALDVVAHHGDGATSVRRARNVVIALGLQPRIPSGAALGERVWHNSRLVPGVAGWSGAAPERCVVVGAGQSAAETAEYLHRSFPESEVHAVFARYGYSTSDDTSFANRIFDPEAVDSYYVASDEVKTMLRGYHGNTNYSVVDPDLIEELYRRVYREKIDGRQRLHMQNMTRVDEVRQDGDRVAVAVEHLPSGERRRIDADLLVYATGYRPASPDQLLGGLGEHTPDGGLAIGRDYRVATAEPSDCGIYVQGATERTHGISSTLLSNTAVRAGEILGSIASRVPARAAA